jgi:hypothetical protein
MRTIETTLFKFEELNEKAKEKARDWAMGLELFGWSEESLQSIKAFCKEYGVKLTAWSVGPWSPYSFDTDVENKHFRGLKLKKVKPDYMPTGYCIDCTLFGTFHSEFKRTGNALGAFDSALHAGFKEWREDWESAYNDEQIDEFLTANEFTENGERF